MIDYYDRGGNANPRLDAELHPLKFTVAEKRALAAFLRALSGTVQEGVRVVSAGRSSALRGDRLGAEFTCRALAAVRGD